MEADQLVPDPEVLKELAISAMTAWRWDRDPEMAALGWPPPIRQRHGKNVRKYRYRRQINIFKQNRFRAALDDRALATGAPA